jgi:hypothetical protein
MTIKERLESSVRILTTIDELREGYGDPSIFSSVERQVVDRELSELASEWTQRPHASVEAKERRLW